MSNYLQAYINSESLLIYQQKVEKSEKLKDEKIKKKVFVAVETNPSEKESLNAMFQPKETEEDGKTFIQYVSPEYASRSQARDLYKALDEKIKERQAREKGICPVREELYSQCFDEIIRQCTIECPERGLFLLRIRDQIKMNIASYQTLYESATLFGVKKQLQAEVNKGNLKQKLDTITEKRDKLISRKVQLENQLKALEKRNQERYDLINNNLQEEKQFIETQKSNLSKFSSLFDLKID